MTARACYSCGATAADGAVLPRLKPTRGDLLCADCAALPGCLADRVRDRLATYDRGERPRTRASYRQALRHRQASAQGDLVDLVVRAP